MEKILDILSVDANLEVFIAVIGVNAEHVDTNLEHIKSADIFKNEYLMVV